MKSPGTAVRACLWFWSFRKILMRRPLSSGSRRRLNFPRHTARRSWPPWRRRKTNKKGRGMDVLSVRRFHLGGDVLVAAVHFVDELALLDGFGILAHALQHAAKSVNKLFL